MFVTLMIWLLSLMAGSGVYGMVGDQVGYQAGGTGTFGWDNETWRVIYSVLAGIATSHLPGIIKTIVEKFFPQYWPLIEKLLEAFKILTPKEAKQGSRDLVEAQEAIGTLAGYFACHKCKDGIEKTGNLFTHVYELDLKDREAAVQSTP